MPIVGLFAATSGLVVASAFWWEPADVVLFGWLLVLVQIAIALRQTSYVGLFASLVTVSVVLTHWPLRLTFWIERDKLEAMAKTIAPGHVSDQTLWFHATRAEVNGIGWHCIWVGRDSTGRRGFVRSNDLAKKLSIAYVGYSVILDEEWAFFSEE